jgi:hypothetical protein
MGYIETFISVLCQNSQEKENYGIALREWAYRGEIYKENNACICGHPIIENMVVHNLKNRNRLIIGNCCIKKFGIKKEHFNKSPKYYFEYALAAARTDAQEAFIIQLQANMEKYGTLRLTQKQYDWLIKITGKPYRWHWVLREVY